MTKEKFPEKALWGYGLRIENSLLITTSILPAGNQDVKSGMGESQALDT